MTTKHLAIIVLALCVGCAYGELFVGKEPAEQWKDRVFATNICAEEAFSLGHMDGFISGWEDAREHYAGDDCLSVGECDDRADVRWIKGWQDGFSNGVQCAKYFGVRLIEITETNYVVITNTVYVTNCPEQRLIWPTNWNVPTTLLNVEAR